MKRLIVRVLSLVVLPFLFSPDALGAGGDVILRTDNGADGYYYGLGGSGLDRFISEYLAGTFLPGAIICGARVRELNQGTLPPPGSMGGDLRLEDPANPGYPDLSVAGLLGVADPASLGTCSMSSALPRFFTFDNGAGVPDPGTNHYVSAIEPLQGTAGTLDFCGVLLDTSSAPQGFAKAYSGGCFRSIPWNHLVELIVFVPVPMDLHLRAHGSARFPGDTGLPVVFTNRPNSSGSITDDNISLTLAFDNTTGGAIGRNVEICADRQVISPRRGFTPVTGAFRSIGSEDEIRNPIVFPVGRTILRLEIERDALKTRAAIVAERRVVNLPLRVLVDDPGLDTAPCYLDGRIDVDSEVRALGLRRRAGSPDDNTADAVFVVQAPNRPGDAFNVRHRAVNLPRSVSYAVTGFEVVGGEFGGSGLPGLDAIELRTEDPVFSGSPDLSGAGLLGSFGTADGVGEAPLPDLGAAEVFDVADVAIDPARLRGDLFTVGLLLPGETSPVTAIGADQVPGRHASRRFVFHDERRPPGHIRRRLELHDPTAPRRRSSDARRRQAGARGSAREPVRAARGPVHRDRPEEPRASRLARPRVRLDTASKSFVAFRRASTSTEPPARQALAR